MMPGDPDTFGEDRYQEAVINFNTQGEITNFQLAISNNLYTQVIKKNASVKDMRCRQMILDYVEQFRTAYNTKDMEFLEQIFSEDALIITGKVVKRQSVEKGFGFMGDKAKVEYSVQSKKQYLGRLANVFRNNKRIHVVFDEIKVYAHPAKENYYGVLLKQGYSSDSYSDIGYLFLLWDFNNEAGPKIHVRTWQPEKIDANTPLPLDEIFSVDDFEFNNNNNNMKKLILFLSLFMAVSSSVFAQEIRVKSYKALERDLTARTQERLDRNDNPCSVIKIVSSGKDFSFEGNVIGDPVVKNGETMIYITEGTRRLTIRHAKYGVLRYELPERVKKQTVYELALKLIEDKNNKLRTLVMPVAGINPEQFSYGIMVGLVKRTGGYIKARYSFKNVSTDNMECDDSGVLTGTEGSLPWYSGNTEKAV
ncbi:MAG: nuclear transport factor 2 family protein [Parabacteroides sp.]|nr:nuclear transport factor 2 family protein [Parabacteroides sp.]